MNAIRLTLPRTTVFGEDSMQKLDVLAKGLGKKAIVLVFENRSDIRRRVRGLLNSTGVEVVFLDVMDGEPEAAYLDAGAQACRDNGCDLVVSVGGGSVIDAGKSRLPPAP